LRLKLEVALVRRLMFGPFALRDITLSPLDVAWHTRICFKEPAQPSW